MSTHDMNIANAAFPAVRADLNLALAAIVENSSSSTEPSTTFAYQFWADTTTGILKQRNAANTAWISLWTISTGAWLAVPTKSAKDNSTSPASTAYVDAADFPVGTRMLFNQTAAPTGWTKDTTAALNDSALRIITGTVGSGGSAAFSTALGVISIGGSTASHTLVTSEIPAHSHSYDVYYDSSANGAVSGGRQNNLGVSGTPSTNNTGGGGGHSHGAGTLSATINVKYNDVIIATKA